MRIAPKLFIPIAMLLLVSGIVTFAEQAKAYLGTEEQQFEADIREARARARDFQRTLDRWAKEEEERESDAQIAKRQREQEAVERDKLREAFVRQRNNQPDESLERDKLEAAYEKQKELEEKKMDAFRRAYIQKRNKVRDLIDREAKIDEAKEYGL